MSKTAVFLRSLMIPEFARHGPATNTTFSEKCNAFYKSARRSYTNLSIDFVPCERCLLWPPQAADWPTRTRDHGWPDATTINMVVSNGCDVVGAVHPICRQDEWMNKYQFRLSFSRAEVTLLNSWTRVQQIIYHMLRFVIKHEVLSRNKDSDLPKLSNYHIKTLMMWECEQKPQSWWSADSFLVKLCSSLLQKLFVWIEDKHCQHYFIGNGNLFDHFLDDDSLRICNSLQSLMDVTVLLPWFVENYLCRCAMYCPAEVSVLFADVSSRDKLEQAVHAVVNWKLSTRAQELCADSHKYEQLMLSIPLISCTDATTTPKLMKGKQALDPRLSDYLNAVIILRVAYTISMRSLTEGVLDMMWTLFDPGSAAAADFASGKFESEGILSIKKAITLALLPNVHSSALEMLHNELSKAYLHHALSIEHGSPYIHCVVHVLLAILYYKSGHYQTVVDHCNQVLNCQDASRLCCIGAEHLPQVDECVDSVLGLFLLYQKVQREAPMPGVESQQECKPAFTTQLLALYLHSKCSTVAYSKGSAVTKYLLHLSSIERAPVCDVLLLKQMEMQKEMADVISRTEDVYARNSMDTSLLVIMLELVALEKLITFRQSLVRELHSEQFPALNEFEALHAYKCGLFEECLEMCQNYVKMLLRVGYSRNQLYPIVMPEFLSMLDGELSSLFGIIKLLHPVLLLFLMKFPDCELISLLTLSLYLMVQCQKKLRSDALRDTLQLIRVVHDTVIPDVGENFADRLILKVTYRSLKLYIDDSTCDDQRPIH